MKTGASAATERVELELSPKEKTALGCRSLGRYARRPKDVEREQEIGQEQKVRIPIVSRGRTVGVLELRSTRSDIFTEDFLAYLESTTKDIGDAIESMEYLNGIRHPTG